MISYRNKYIKTSIKIGKNDIFLRLVLGLNVLNDGIKMFLDSVIKVE